MYQFRLQRRVCSHPKRANGYLLGLLHIRKVASSKAAPLFPTFRVSLMAGYELTNVKRLVIDHVKS